MSTTDKKDTQQEEESVMEVDSEGMSSQSSQEDVEVDDQIEMENNGDGDSNSEDGDSRVTASDDDSDNEDEDEEDQSTEGLRRAESGNRKRSGRATRPPGDFQDFDTSFEAAEAFDDSDADGSTIAAQVFFMEQLDEFIRDQQLKVQQGHNDEEEGGRPKRRAAGEVWDPQQWRVQVLTQRRGLSAGFVTVYYHRMSSSLAASSAPRKFKSRVEVGMELGVFPPVRSLRALSRPLQHLLAVEARERALMAQRILAHEDPGCIEEFFIDPASGLVQARPCPTHASPKVFSAHCFPLVPGARVRSDDEREADKEVRVPGPESVITDHHRSLDAIREFSAAYGFSYGNTCVVNYGQIVHNGHFHTREQLYPLGLKFVRQEHDRLAERVVDCVCEVDCTLLSRPDEHPLQHCSLEDLSPEDLADLRPLFRVTVAWDVGFGRHALRVYEAKNPQLVWQAVLLERLGTPGNECAEASAAPLEEEMSALLARVQSDKDLVAAAPTPLEPMDAEERRLRAEVVELRRMHMRALSAGQEKGEMQPVVTRLSLLHVDQFYDVGLLPLLEGLPGVELCEGYQFQDSRHVDPPRAVLMKQLSRMQTKVRDLDKVVAKFASERVTALLNIRKEQKREAAEQVKLLKKEDRARRTERSQAMVERRNRAKDLEKTARQLRDEAARALSSRRLQAKFRVELLAKGEEALPALGEALSSAMREEERRDRQADREAAIKLGEIAEDDEEEEDIEAEEEEEEAEEEEDRSIPRFARRPRDEASALLLPQGEPLSLPPATFGRTMELWQFLVTHADVLGLVALPTERHFETALSMCDPAMMRMQGILNRAQAQLGPWTVSEERGEGEEVEVELLAHPARVTTRREAKDMLTKLALVLCRPLMQEYSRAMSTEAAEPYLGGLALDLNELTWKEVARVVLTATLCRHSGLTDHETSSCLRGRGHLTAPDVSDRRVLRLAKRRLWFRYSQHLYRNQPDPAAIVTPQNKDAMNHSLYRQHMLMHSYLGLGADFTGGLVLRITAPAVFDDSDPAGVEGDAGVGAGWVMQQAQLVVFWCQLYTHLGLASAEAPFAGTWLALELTMRLLERVLQGRHCELHRAALHVLRLCRAPSARSHGRHFPQAVHGVLCLVLRRLLETATLGLKQGEGREAARVQAVLDNIDTNPCRIGASLSASPSVSHSDNSSASAVRVVVDVASKKQQSHDQPSMLQLYRRSKKVRAWAPFTPFVPTSSSAIAAAKHREGEDDMEVEQEQDQEQDVEQEDKGDQGAEKDRAADGADAAAAAELERARQQQEQQEQQRLHDQASLLLPSAQQRLYRALRHLMQHAQAATFSAPVDGDLVKGYHVFVRHPLCLADIMTHLLAGGYAGEAGLRCWYEDVVLVFQNAAAFNEESTAIAQAAFKLQFVFDRLVYECVLTLAAPLADLDHCHACAASYLGDEGATVICDRCDGSYHVECLCPPLPAPPRGEWFCPSCVAERGPELVHPLRGAVVRDPLDPGGAFFGRVVGLVPRVGRRSVAGGGENCLDCCEDTDGANPDEDMWESYLEYHIEFGFSEEDLPMLKAVSGGEGEGGEGGGSRALDVLGKGHQKTSVWRLQDVLQFRHTFLSSGSCEELPDGYSFESYDQLAAAAACHRGWGESPGALPPCLEPAHSRSALLLAGAEDCDRLGMVQRGAAVVGALAAGVELRSEDWVSVLLALAYKAGSVDSRFNEKGQAVERALEGRYMDLVRGLRQERHCVSLGEFQRRPGAVVIGAQLLVAGEEEYLQQEEEDAAGSEEEGERDSNSDTEGDSDEEGADSAEDEDEDEDGEDGEDGVDGEDGEDDVERVKQKAPQDSDEEQSEEDDLWDESLEQQATSQRNEQAPRAGINDDDSDADAVADGGAEVGSEEERSEEEGGSDDDVWDEDMEQAARAGLLLGEKPPQTLFSWEMQRRSRRRGVEDALLTMSVAQALNTRLLDDDVHHQDEDRASSAGAVSQLAPGGLLCPVVRQCLPRVVLGDDTDMEVWTPAYEARLFLAAEKQLACHSKLMKQGSVEAEEAGEKEEEEKRLCAWCAHPEEFTCSQFVHGHTWEEWFAWKQGREERARARQAAVDDEAARELDRILGGGGGEEEEEEEGGGQGVAAPATMVQVWLPANKTDAAHVLKEAELSASTGTSTFPPCSTSGGGGGADSGANESELLLPPPNVEIEVLRGSVVVHECCAEAMNAARMTRYTAQLDAFQQAYRAQRRRQMQSSKVVKQSSAVQRRLEAALRTALTRKEGQYPEERGLADVLVGLGQGKVVSLGCDFSGNVYYALSGSRALLVCGRRSPDYSLLEGDAPLPACEEKAPFSLVPMPDPLGSFSSQQEGQGVQPRKQWQMYRSAAQIAAITAQLSRDAAPERSLRGALEVLYLRHHDQHEEEEEEDEDKKGEEGQKQAQPLADQLASVEQYQALLSRDLSTLQLGGREDGGTELGKRKAESSSAAEEAAYKMRALASTWQQCTSTSLTTTTTAGSSGSSGEPSFAVGARVLCEGHDCLGNALLWDARVLAGPPIGEKQLWKVRYTGWGAQYDSWVPVDELHSVTAAARVKQGALHSRAGAFSYTLPADSSPHVPLRPWVPEILTTLCAHAYIAAPGRHNQREARRTSGLPPVVFSSSRNGVVPRLCSSRRSPGDEEDEEEDEEGDVVVEDRGSTVQTVRLSVTDELSVLKAAMLLVQAALPLGAMDNAEDRWGRGPVSPVPCFESMALSDAATGGGAANQGPSFFNAWRHGVLNASSAALLMECQLMLEYSVRTAWLKSTGAKLMTCLPSRSQAVRAPTLGLVATRLWCLDKAVRYDKVQKGEGEVMEDEGELRKEKSNKLRAKQASRKRQQQKEEHNKKRAQYRR